MELLDLKRVVREEDDPMMNGSEVVRQAWAGQRVLRIRYQKPEDCEVSVREVEIYRWDGVYIDAYCRLRNEPRTFRVDRIQSANLLEEEFRRDPSIEDFFRVHGWAQMSQSSPLPVRAPSKSTEPEPPEEEKGSPGFLGHFLRVVTLGLWS
jgi:predicted DNA-binding transcriptional regulator YafY